MAFDLLICLKNTPGALAQVAAAISDAGVNIAAATCIGSGDRAELHILVPHAEAAKHSLAISHLAVTRERAVVVIAAEDRPGVLADLTRKVAAAGVNLDLVYVATGDRVVFGADDLGALRAALESAGGCGARGRGADSRSANHALTAHGRWFNTRPDPCAAVQLSTVQPMHVGQLPTTKLPKANPSRGGGAKPE